MPAQIPEPIRAAAGLAVTVLGQARQLPANITGLPVRVAGLAMQASLRVQQSYAGLVVRGDELLTQIGRPGDEDPPWATFDDEVVEMAEGVTEGHGLGVDSTVPAATGGPPIDALPGTTRQRPARTDADGLVPGQAPSSFDLAGDQPADAIETPEPPVPGYDSLTLAQLRARLRTFDLATLSALLAYERQRRARTPYLTMLENRLNRSRERG